MSTADRFRRVDEIFDAAVDLPTDQQAAFVTSACGGDAALRNEVADLLRAHHRAGGLLDSPGRSLPTDLFDRTERGSDPPRIGPFRLVRALGQGGMGQVFLGERVGDDFQQRAAVKVIRYPVAGLVRRFLDERRILAALEHPGIARLIDGGLTPEGLPYFAMEYVDGQPIDQYCADRNLPLDARLALFLEVCDAVSYAHQHLVIHRDLKPSNILVTTDGRVKLLDFGIAKLVGPNDGRRREDTRTGLVVMTPEIAAPEQVRGNPVSTATDVYSLGILLYRLISGRRPYQIETDSPLEIERLICDVDPPTPSSVAGVAWARRLRGDLDVIAMTALQKDERRRYQGPAALAADIRRFQAGHAISAQPDRFGYRMAKFVGRHRLAVATAVLVVAGLVIGVARERNLRAVAERSTRKAVAVESFLLQVFGDADPFGVHGGDSGAVSVQVLLDRGVRRLDTVLVDQPDLQAELRTALGQVYANLGMYDRARPLLERALAQRMSLPDPDEAGMAAALDALGMTLTQLDEFPEAERLLRDALARRRRILGPRSPMTAASIEHLATNLQQADRLAPAESLFREALAIRRAALGDSSVETAGTKNDLAVLLYRRGAYAEAEGLYRAALAIEQARLGDRHPLTAATKQNLAQVLQAQGRLAEAEPYYRESLEAKRATLGDRHPSVTIGLNNFGSYLALQLGRLDEGEAMIREAIALDQAIFGREHSFVAEGLRNLGVTLRSRGDFLGSDSALREAATIDRKVLGPRHDKVATILGHWAQTRSQLGDDRGAVRLFREALDQFRETLGDAHPNTLATMSNLARALVQVGGLVEAESLARAAAAGLTAGAAQPTPLAVGVRRTLGLVLVSRQQASEAIPILDTTVVNSRRLWGDEDWRTGFSLLWYGKALAATGSTSEARQALEAAARILRAERRSQPRLAADADEALATLARRSR